MNIHKILEMGSQWTRNTGLILEVICICTRTQKTCLLQTFKLHFTQQLHMQNSIAMTPSQLHVQLLMLKTQNSSSKNKQTKFLKFWKLSNIYITFSDVPDFNFLNLASAGFGRIYIFKSGWSEGNYRCIPLT